MRFATSCAAVLCACAISVSAQESKTKSKTKVEGNGQTVTYTGCVQSGAETRSFILQKVVPVSQTRTTEVTGTGGTVASTSTTYALVPGERVELQQYVGHKVEVTGVMIPPGESKTESKTKIEREHGKDVTVKSKSKSDSDHPQFKVISVKHLADTCM